MDEDEFAFLDIVRLEQASSDVQVQIDESLIPQAASADFSRHGLGSLDVLLLIGVDEF
jgi:hypothetical protein